MSISITCKLCDVSCAEKDKTNHIFKFHMQGQMYKCPFCDFETNNKNSGHVSREHVNGAAVGLISQVDVYLNELSSWKNRCFPEETEIIQNSSNQVSNLGLQAEKRKMMAADTEQEEKNDLASKLPRIEQIPLATPLAKYGSELNEKNLTRRYWLPCNNWESSVQRKLKKIKLQVLKPSENQTKCNLCNSIIDKGQMNGHVKDFHLKTPVFSNSFCEFRSNSLVHLKRHLNRVHHLAKNVEIFKRDKAEVNLEVQNLREICFGNQNNPISTSSSTPKPEIFNLPQNDPPNSKAIRCEKCHFVLSNSVNWSSHIYAVHLKDVYECSGCKKTYGCKNSIVTHIKKCPTNGRVNYIGQNIKERHSLLKLECFPELFKKELQKEIEKFQNNLETASSESHDEGGNSSEKPKYHICKLCPASTKVYNGKQYDHVERHHLKFQFSCQFCPQKSLVSQYLSRHIQRAHEQLGTCKTLVLGQVPQEILTRRKQLVQQCFSSKSTTLEQEPGMIQCQKCENFVKDQASCRAAHIQAAHMKEQFQCSGCQRTYGLKQSIENHVRKSCPRNGEVRFIGVGDAKETFNCLKKECFPWA